MNDSRDAGDGLIECRLLVHRGHYLRLEFSQTVLGVEEPVHPGLLIA